MSRGVEDIPLKDRYTDSRHAIIFNQCDENRDGFICFRELENYISIHYDECSCIPERVLKKIHKKADADGNKLLNFEEFVELLESKGLEYHLHRCIASYLHHLVPHPKKTTAPFQLRSIRIEKDDEHNLCNEYSCCPPPIFMFLISVLEFALFITDELTQKDSTLTATGVTGKYLLYDPFKKREVWRFLTYMFVHIGYNHIIMNLIVQLALGIPLEMVNKWRRVLTVYFLGGIAGCLAHAVIDGSVRLGGASGGVYALMTAHLAQVIMNWSDLPFAYVQFIVFGIIITVDLGSAAYHRYYMNVVNEIGVTCHLGGALAGILVGIYILKNVHVTSAENYIWWSALVVYVLLTGGAILAVIFT